MMKTKKKSQMEIMGLAIVIILITLGIFFFIYYSSVKKPIEQKKEFGNVQLATNIINSILETTTANCYGQTFSEVLQKCASGAEITCGEGSTYCEYFKKNVYDNADSIFKSTFYLWIPRYSFYIEYVNPPSDQPPFPIGPLKEDCLRNEEQTARQFTIPSNPPSQIV